MRALTFFLGGGEVGGGFNYLFPTRHRDESIFFGKNLVSVGEVGGCWDLSIRAYTNLRGGSERPTTAKQRIGQVHCIYKEIHTLDMYIEWDDASVGHISLVAAKIYMGRRTYI